MHLTLTPNSTPARTIRRPELAHFTAACALAVLVLSGILAGSAEATVDFTFTVEKAIKIGPTGFDYVKVDCIIENTGTENDLYDILRVAQDLPGDWTTSICTGGDDGFLTNGQLGGCMANFVDSLYAGTPPCPPQSCAGPSNLSLEPGQTDTVSCYFTPVQTDSSGYATLDVRSVGDPSLRLRLELGCVTDGVDLLLVNDTTDETVAPYYAAAVPGILSRGTWKRQLAKLTVGDLANYGITVWFTGAETSTLDEDDRSALAAYLTGGGQLFLSGQDIAYDLNDPASPNQSPATVSWYETALHSRYVGNDSGSFSIFGVMDDPISSGLDLDIQGGDGANNQTDPDEIEALLGGGGVWSYSMGAAPLGGVRWLDNGNRGVNFPFGFEAISCASCRENVMIRIITWFMESPIGVDDAGVATVPSAFELEQARPNPFNPSTQIAFTLNEPGMARLRVLDASGRPVRLLADGATAAGRHEVHWDGRDESGREVASGVYVAELSVDGRGAERVKLSLIR